MPKLNARLLVIGCLSLGLLACTKHPNDLEPGTREEITSLKQLKGIARGHYRTVQSRMKGIRVAALKETALSVGAQGGLADMSKRINDMLGQHASYMDQVYNFNLIMLEDNVLPPVLVEGRTTLNDPEGLPPGSLPPASLRDHDALIHSQVLRLADRSYKIVKQARFATTPPNWREYLWMNYKYPERPDFTLIPKTERELKVWEKYSEQGWQNGAKQAQTIFNNNLALLRRDFLGMIRYRKLLANRMVTAPFVQKAELGITGGGNAMRVDDRVLRIAALPELVPTGKDWKSNIAQDKTPEIDEHRFPDPRVWNPVIAP